MSTGFMTRRRADRFDALLADPAAGADDPRFAELLEVVGRLGEVEAPRPRAGFSVSLREQLMAEAETALLPHDREAEDRLTLPARTGRTARSPRDRRLAVAAGALAMVGATTSMAVAAQTALPGDTLYPVKRALEDVHAGVSMGDAARGSTLLANATGRLDEVSELVRIGSDDSLAAAPEALGDFAAQAEEGSALLLDDYRETGDADSVAKVRDFAGQSLAVLGELEGELPPEADVELLRAAEVLAEIDATAADLCATCGGLGIAEIPPSLMSAVADGLPPGSGVETQPVQPAQPLQPTDPSSGSGSGGSGSGPEGRGGSGAGGSGGGSGASDGGVQLPETGGVLPPGSVTGDTGTDPGPVEDLTRGLLGDGSTGASQGSDNLLQPLKETSKQLDELLESAGLTGNGNAGSGLTGNLGSGNQGSGNQGAGKQGSGKQGSGKQGSGKQGGKKGPGKKGSGKKGSGQGGSDQGGSGTGGLLDGLLGD